MIASTAPAALATVELAAQACAWFISDLHLWLDRPRTHARFAAFIECAVGAADALFILGDLFEYWAGDDDIAAPAVAPVIAVLRHASARGLRLFFLAGNRDFLVGETCLRACGADALAENCVLAVGTQRILLLHGDTLCTDDHGYQSFRTQVRSARWQAAFLAKPLRERHAIIADLRARSEDKKSRVAAAIMDANPQAIDAAFRRHGVHTMIHGHTHRPALHRSPAGERWVLPDWEFDDAPTRGGGLILDDAGIRTINA